ncbi:MAG TPA: nitronate monooxygenase [Nocardioidaceae bacterium]|nr:nitronate monooxygenase [Nocardioidaceae bacterium]
MRNWLTERFELTVPVIGAPMAGPGEGALAAAVSAGGGLGMIGVNASRDAGWVAAQADLAGAGGQRFGIGLMAWALESRPEQLDAAVAAGPALVSVSFGDFEPHVTRLKEAGIAVTTQAGNLDEALRAERAGVDLVVARGAEAGGHGRDEVGTLPLLQTVLEHVTVPVVAAGGIAGPRGLAAVLAAGAVGAWVGTAFLGCPEAGNTSAARRALFAATDAGTSYGRVFDVAQQLPWPPEFGGRGLRNTYFDTWSDRLDELAHDDAAAEQLRAARADEDFDTAYLYAGQGVGLLREERPASDVLADFARAAELLKRF